MGQSPHQLPRVGNSPAHHRTRPIGYLNTEDDPQLGNPRVKGTGGSIALRRRSSGGTRRSSREPGDSHDDAAGPAAVVAAAADDGSAGKGRDNDGGGQNQDAEGG